MQEGSLIASASQSPDSLSVLLDDAKEHPSRSTTPTQSNSTSTPINSSTSLKITSTSMTMRQRPSTNQVFFDPSPPPSPAIPGLQSHSSTFPRPITASSRNRSNSGSGNSIISTGSGSASGSQSRQGSGTSSSSSSSSSPQPSTSAGPVSWLSLSLFSDEPDDEEENISQEGAGRVKTGTKGRERRSRNSNHQRSNTPDLDPTESSSESAIDSAETASNSSTSSLQTSRRFQNKLYSNSNRSRSSSREQDQGLLIDGHNRKTKRSASMLAHNADDRRRLNSSFQDRPQSGYGLGAESEAGGSGGSLSSRRLPSNHPSTRHGHSRSSSTSDSYNINIPTSSTSNQLELNPPASPRWSTHARRLSSSLSKSASPFLKAGLDELRDIFDVESERDGWREKEWSKEKDRQIEEEVSKNSILPITSSPRRQTSGREELTNAFDGGVVASGSRNRIGHKSRPSTAPTWLESSPSTSSLTPRGVVPKTSSPNLLATSTSMPRQLDASPLSRNSSTRISAGLLSPPISTSVRPARERQTSAPPSLVDHFENLNGRSNEQEMPRHPGSATMSRNNSNRSNRSNTDGKVSPALTLDMNMDMDSEKPARKGSSSSNASVSTAIDIVARRRVALGLVMLVAGIFGIELFEYWRGEFWLADNQLGPTQ